MPNKTQDRDKAYCVAVLNQHGISFEEAQTVFFDDDAIEFDAQITLYMKDRTKEKRIGSF